MGSRCVGLELAEEAPKFLGTLGWSQEGIRTCLYPSLTQPPSQSQILEKAESPALTSVAPACLDLAIIHCQSP